MPGEHPVEKYTPYFKTSTKAVGQSGSWWAVTQDKELMNSVKVMQKKYMRENKPGAWPWDHHGWYTMDLYAKDHLKSKRLHAWAGCLCVGAAAAFFTIRVKDWKWNP